MKEGVVEGMNTVCPWEGIKTRLVRAVVVMESSVNWG